MDLREHIGEIPVLPRPGSGFKPPHAAARADLAFLPGRERLAGHDFRALVSYEQP